MRPNNNRVYNNWWVLLLRDISFVFLYGFVTGLVGHLFGSYLSRSFLSWLIAIQTPSLNRCDRETEVLDVMFKYKLLYRNAIPHCQQNSSYINCTIDGSSNVAFDAHKTCRSLGGQLITKQYESMTCNVFNKNNTKQYVASASILNNVKCIGISCTSRYSIFSSTLFEAEESLAVTMKRFLKGSEEAGDPFKATKLALVKSSKNEYKPFNTASLEVVQAFMARWEVGDGHHSVYCQGNASGTTYYYFVPPKVVSLSY